MYQDLLELVDEVLGDAGGPGEFKYDGGPKPYVKKSGEVSEKSKERVEQFNSGTLPSSEPQTIPVPTEEQYAQAQALVEKYYDFKESESIKNQQSLFNNWVDHNDQFENPETGFNIERNTLKSDASKFQQTDVMSNEEIESVKAYQSNPFFIQNYLISGDVNKPSVESDLNHDITQIDSAISKFQLKEDTNVYRGISVTSEEKTSATSKEYIDSFINSKPGRIISNEAFTSTSIDKFTAKTYAGSDGVTLEFHVKKGENGLYINLISQTEDLHAVDEREVILPRNSKFEIISVDKENRHVILKRHNELATDSIALDYTFIPEEHPRQKDPDWGGKPQEGGTGSTEPAASPATIPVPTQEQREHAQELVGKYYESNLKERMQEILQEKTGQLANYYSEIEKIYSEGKLSEEGYKNILSGKEKDYGYSTSEERIKYQAEQELKEEEERTPEQKEKLIKSQQKSLVSERKELQENDDRGGAEHLSKDAKFWKQNEPLTKFQKNTIRGYQFQSAHVQDYSINGPDPNESDYVNNRNKKLSDTMSKIAQSFEASKDVTVHRVLTHDEEVKGSKEYVESLLNAEPGTEVHNKAFSSTTMYKGADKYRGTPEQSLDLEISIKKGQKGAIPVNSTYIGDYWDEREIILDKNSRLRVDSVDKEKRIVKLSLMDKEEKQDKPATDSISIRSDLYYVIETPKGHLRIGHGWQNRSPTDYGYIVGYAGADGDEMDCYLGPNRWSNVVYVIDQNQIGSTQFDEHKCMIGYASESQALKDYYAGHNLGKQIFRGITAMSKPRFINWLKTGNLTKPLTQNKKKVT